ncbi:unnamed protein product [Ilex paraguariensis]|uniref:Uncharacterized protein n=1 Tax=Ilex paraguariensis TaxID=185542 RepID=A0ABC8TQN6_9AQUA
MGDEGVRWQKIIYERRNQYCKSYKKQRHREETCRKRKVLPMGDDGQGQSMDLEVNNSAKASKEQMKGKEVSLGSNPKTITKETQDLKKYQQQTKHPKPTQQSKGIWKQQQQPRQVNNPAKETTITFGKASQTVITVRDMEKEKLSASMENGEHSGKSIVDQNGENILQTESAQRRDTEDILVTNPDLVLEGDGFNRHDMQDPAVMQEGGDSDKGVQNLSLNDAMTCDSPSNQNNVASPPDQNNDAETMIKFGYDSAAYSWLI